MSSQIRSRARPANFAAAATITVASSTDAGGAVTGGGTFYVGSNTVLTATPSNGWAFVNWSDGDPSNPHTITVVSNTAYTANFALCTYALTVSSTNVTAPAGAGSVSAAVPVRDAGGNAELGGGAGLVAGCGGAVLGA